MCSVTTVFSNLASLTCETMCTSTIPREIVNLKQRTDDKECGRTDDRQYLRTDDRQRRRGKSAPSRSTRLQGNLLPKKPYSGAKKCAVVIPTRKPSSGTTEDLYTFTRSTSQTDLSALKLQKRRSKTKHRRQSTESSGSSSGVSTADSKLFQELNNNNACTNKPDSEVTETKGSTNVADEDNLSLAPDAYYDSCSYESCSLLSLPVLPFPDAAVSKVYRKRKRQKRITKRKERKSSICKENVIIHCAVDNLSVVEREDKGVADTTRSARFANLSFLTCESKENVDHCTCGRNVEIMKDEVSCVEYSPNSTKSDSSQDNGENQNTNEVSLRCND